MAINAIFFDLDGVLVDTKEIHYISLNMALTPYGEKYKINLNDHLSSYDGLSTRKKLQKLTKERGLPESYHNKIWASKQKYTNLLLNDNIKKNEDLINLLKYLHTNYIVAICSNAITSTIKTCMDKLEISKYVDFIISNEDVSLGKPSSQIYIKALDVAEVNPNEVLIIEDSPNGLKSAYGITSNVLRINSPKDLTKDLILEKIEELEKCNNDIPWVDKNINVLIPMAGAGSRFENAGYSLPKPLIDVNGVPMIKKVVDNLRIDGNYIFIVRKEHYEKYNLGVILNLIKPNCKIIQLDKITEGAACTTLLAKEFINNDNPLIIANSDQYVEYDSLDFMYSCYESKNDATILTFNDDNPKWSFALLNELGHVTRVEEKNPISNIATVGIYFYKKGSEYVKYAEQMIDKNIRVNSEFYVCPVFNEYIKDNKIIKTYNAKKMWGIGTPEDLEFYLKNHK